MSRLEPEAVLHAIKAVGTATLEDLAEYFEVHEGTIRRKVEALEYRGEIKKVPGTGKPRIPAIYQYGDGSPEQDVPLADDGSWD